MSDAPVKIHRLGQTRRFAFADATCLGCQCFEPMVVRELDSSLEHASCRVRFLKGCPDTAERRYSMLTVIKRDRDGWRIDK